MSLVPVESFVAPVKDNADLFAFSIEGKALTDESITVAENGDLIIEGYAAVWEGEDREGENFMPGAFQRASKAFLEAGGPLCFHHQKEQVLGAVTELEEDAKGLRLRARVDSEIQSDPALKRIYGQIKKGTLRGLSVGGFFKRALVEGRQKISDMDFTEISVTGVPIHTGPSFSVVAGKALLSDVEVPVAPQIDTEIRSSDLDSLKWQIDDLTNTFKRIAASVAARATG